MSDPKVVVLIAPLFGSIAAAISLLGCAPLQGEEPVGDTGITTANEVADPAKLLTAKPGSAVMEARVSTRLLAENGCLVVRGETASTIVWPAGTKLSADGRSVIVPGTRRPLEIGKRLVASGGFVKLEGTPAGAHAAAVRNGCPGDLVTLAEITIEE
jgi:hypothetical protein